MQICEVIDLATGRPWGPVPWAQPLLQRLPEQLAAAVKRWDLVLESAYRDGAGLPVLAVRSAGRPAVLVLDGVGRNLDQQVRILDAAAGNGYVRLLDHAPELGAALLERLGQPLAITVPDPVEQTHALCDLLERTWQLPLTVGESTALGDKARGLLGIARGALADESLRSEHGTLLERAAGIALELAGPIEHLERTEGPGAGRRWHAELTRTVAQRLDLDAGRVAAWALLERVTTGVHLGRLGYAEESTAWLGLAARM